MQALTLGVIKDLTALRLENKITDQEMVGVLNRMNFYPKKGNLLNDVVCTINNNRRNTIERN